MPLTLEAEFDKPTQDFGFSPSHRSVDWVPIPDVSWLTMNGVQAIGVTFADPIESSLYFSGHFR